MDALLTVLRRSFLFGRYNPYARAAENALWAILGTLRGIFGNEEFRLKRVLIADDDFTYRPCFSQMSMNFSMVVL